MLKNQNNKKGFTLIEIMVSISIFSIVMLIVIGALLMLNDANKKSQAVRSVVDNLNFAIEDMSRKMKTGKDFRCGDNLEAIKTCLEDPNGTDKIFLQFKPAGRGVGSESNNFNYDHYLYYFDNEKQTIGYKVKEKAYGDWVDFGSMISPEVKIKDLTFYVSENPGTELSIITITLNGEFDLSQFGDNQKFKTPFSIQTTVSQRANVF